MLRLLRIARLRLGLVIMSLIFDCMKDLLLVEIKNSPLNLKSPEMSI